MFRDCLTPLMTRVRRVMTAAAALVLVVACGGPSLPSVADPPGPTPTGGDAAASGLTLQDAWVKASPSGVTSLFGVLVNPTAHPMTVAAATSPAANMIEFHEVVLVDGARRMRIKLGGFAVPARGTHRLEPGGDHIMLIGLRRPVMPGDAVSATLLPSGGAALTVTAICKDFAGGNEEYAISSVSPRAGGNMAGPELPGAEKS